MKCQIAFIISF